MGVKSYIAGLKKDAIDSFANSATQGSALYAAKVKTDVIRESVKIESELNTWFEQLKMDPNYEGYGDKKEEKFAELVSEIDKRDDLGSLAKHQIKNEIIPKYQQSIDGSVNILKNNAQFTQLEINRQGHADLIIASEMNLNDSKEEYKKYVENLDIYTPENVTRLMKEFDYIATPQKVLQDYQAQYEEHYLDPEFSMETFLSENVHKLAVGEEPTQGDKINLDVAQYNAFTQNAAAFKTQFDEHINKQSEQKINQIMGDLDLIEYNGDKVSIEEFDTILETIPPRFNSQKIAVKNKIHNINDNQILKAIDQGSANLASPDAAIWDEVATIYDPAKKDQAVEDILISGGKFQLYAGTSITKIKDYIYNEGPEIISLRNKQKAYAAVLRDWSENNANSDQLVDFLLSGGSNVQNVTTSELKSMVSSGASKEETTQINVTDDGQVVVVTTPKDETKPQTKQNVRSVQTGDMLKVNPKVAKQIQQAFEQLSNTSGSEEVFEVEEGDTTTLISSKVDGVEVTKDEAYDNYKKTGQNLVKDLSKQDAKEAKNVLDAYNLLNKQTEKQDQPQNQEVQNQEVIESDQVKEEPKESSSDLFDVSKFKEINKSLVLDLGFLETKEKVASTTELKEVIEEKPTVAESLLERGFDPSENYLTIFSSAVEEAKVYEMPNLKGLSQAEVIETLLQAAKDGYATALTNEHFNFISNPEDRDLVKDFVVNKDNFKTNDITAMMEIWDHRVDNSKSPAKLKKMVAEYEAEGLITRDFAEKHIKHSPLADLENWGNISEFITAVLTQAFPHDGSIRSSLRQDVYAKVEEAVLMNPDLIEKDYKKLKGMVRSAIGEKLSQDTIQNMESVFELVKSGKMEPVLKAMVDQDLNTFMEKASRGEYDLFIDYLEINKVDSKIFRSVNGDINKSHTVILNEMTDRLTEYDNYEDLTKYGSNYDKAQVLANSNFLLSAGIFEKALYGSFRIKAADVSLKGNRWAYQDPENPNIWFYPAYSEVQKNEKMNWGMYKYDEKGKLVGNVKFIDLVDPKIWYEAEQAQKDNEIAKERQNKAWAKIAEQQNTISRYGFSSPRPKDDPLRLPEEYPGSPVKYSGGAYWQIRTQEDAQPAKQQSIIDNNNKIIKRAKDQAADAIKNRVYAFPNKAADSNNEVSKN